MNAPLLTINNLRTALSSGELFLFDNDKAALRAWAVQNYSADLEIKRIMDQKPALSSSALFLHWVDILTKVNLFLDEPITPKRTKETATLLDYFLLEEALLSKYIRQVGSRTRFTGLHDMSLFEYQSLNHVTESRAMFQFLRVMPHYVEPDSNLAQFLNQADTACPEAWSKKVSIERTRPKSMFSLFMISALFFSIPVTGLWALSSSTLSELTTKPNFWGFNLIAVLFILLMFHLLASGQDEALENNTPNIGKEIEDCITKHFKPVYTNWYQILGPSTFEGRFLLRVCFNMMHSIDLNGNSAVSAFDTTLRLTLPSDSARVFFSLAVKYLHSTQGQIASMTGSIIIGHGAELPATPNGMPFPDSRSYRSFTIGGYCG